MSKPIDYSSGEDYVLALYRIRQNIRRVQENVGWRPTFADLASIESLEAMAIRGELTCTPVHAMTEIVMNSSGWMPDVPVEIIDWVDEAVYDRVKELGYYREASPDQWVDDLYDGIINHDEEN